MASTVTILASLEWVKKYVYNRQLAIGDFKEPIMTAVNLVKQTTLGKPLRWQFNRVVSGFVCTQGQQDYFLLNSWPASTSVSAGWLLIDSNGNSQKVTTAGTTNSTVPSWNVTKGGTTTDNTATWTNLGPIPNASASYNFGWIENSSVQDIAPTTPKWYPLSNKVDISLDSSQGRPQNISAELTGTLGITFRLLPVPALAYPVAITMQQSASLITSLNATWSPLPDDLGYVYQMGLLSYIYEFADDSRWAPARQRFMAGLLGAAEGLSATEVDIFLNNFGALSLNPIERQLQMQRGEQSRGI